MLPALHLYCVVLRSIEGEKKSPVVGSEEAVTLLVQPDRQNHESRVFTFLSCSCSLVQSHVAATCTCSCLSVAASSDVDPSRQATSRSFPPSSRARSAFPASMVLNASAKTKHSQPINTYHQQSTITEMHLLYLKASMARIIQDALAGRSISYKFCSNEVTA